MPTSAVFQSILDRYHSLIRYAGQRFKVIAKVDPEDLYQEACIELLDMLDSGLDPETVDFRKVFKARMFNKMVDENRKFTQTESRCWTKEIRGNARFGNDDFGEYGGELFGLLREDQILSCCGCLPVRDPSEEAEANELVERVNRFLNEQERQLWQLIVNPPQKLIKQLHRRSRNRKCTRMTPGAKLWGRYLGWSRQKAYTKLKSIRLAVIMALGDDIPKWIERKLSA